MSITKLNSSNLQLYLCQKHFWKEPTAEIF